MSDLDLFVHYPVPPRMRGGPLKAHPTVERIAARITKMRRVPAAYCINRETMCRLGFELEDLAWKQKRPMWGGVIYDRSAWMVRGVPVFAR